MTAGSAVTAPVVPVVGLAAALAATVVGSMTGAWTGSTAGVTDATGGGPSPLAAMPVWVLMGALAGYALSGSV